MKKLTLDTKNMKKVLTAINNLKLKKAINVWEYLKVTENNTFIVNGSEVTGVFYPKIIGSEGNGEYLIKIETFKKAVSKLTSDVFELQMDDNEVLLSAGNINVTLDSLPVWDFPKIKSLDNYKIVTINTKKFYSMLHNVLYTASKDEMMYNLNGILFEFTDNYLTLVSSDSYRLNKIECEITQGEKFNTKMFFNLQTMKQVEKSLKYCKDEITELTLYGTYMAIDIHERIEYTIQMFYSKANFPNYMAVIPNSFQTRITIDREKLLSNLEIVSQTIGKNGTTIFHIDNSINIIGRIKEEKVYNEVSKSVIDGKIEGKPIKVGFDDKFIIEALKHFDTEKIQLSFVDENNALQINEVNNGNYIGIIMPIKIRS